jgi:hypothetical protein
MSSLTRWIEQYSPEHFGDASKVASTLQALEVAPDQSLNAVVLTGIATADPERTITKAYNALRRGGLVVIEVPRYDTFANDIVDVYKNHGVELHEVFFDFAFYDTAESTSAFVAVKISETVGYLPPHPSYEALAPKPRFKTLVYVLTTTLEDHEAAVDRYNVDPRMRVVFAPTTFYGEHVAYFHVLPSRFSEWMHADAVGAVPYQNAQTVEHLLQSLEGDPGKADVYATRVGRGGPTTTALSDWVYSETCKTHQPLVSKGESFNVQGPWLAIPAWMAEYCKIATNVRVLLDSCAEEKKLQLWSPCPDQTKPPTNIETRLQMWGTVDEPWHRNVMDLCPGWLLASSIQFNENRVIVPSAPTESYEKSPN